MSDKTQRETEKKEFLRIMSYKGLHYAWTTAEENEWDVRRACENLGDKKSKCVELEEDGKPGGKKALKRNSYPSSTFPAIVSSTVFHLHVYHDQHY